MVPWHVIIASLMRHRQSLLFTLARCIFYCSLSASVAREIDSSVIGRYGERARQNQRGERGKIIRSKTEELRKNRK